MPPAPPYVYPVSNSELIKAHSLIKHFEGGFFAQTVVLDSQPGDGASVLGLPVSAALGGRVHTASGSGAELLDEGKASEEVTATTPEPSADASLIYYLLTPVSYRGKMHMNLHSTFHIHHAGRALYTLIRPPPQGSSEVPTIRRIIMGSDVSSGEVTQLFVPGGWWKASEIPEEDLLLLSAPDAKGLEDRIGCLISEVVVPGWNPDQHQFINEDKLKAMWAGEEGWQTYTRYLAAPEGLEYPDK